VARSRAAPRPRPAVSAAVGRALPLLPIVAGAALLIAAEGLTLREVRALDVVPPGGRVTAGAHHGYALGLLGLAMLPLGFGAVLRGARPAAVALLVLAAIAAWVVFGIDGPALDDTGLIGRTYDLARAHPGPAWRVERLGAALALAGAAWALLAAWRAPERGGRSRGRRRQRVANGGH
jgi:hypothetical protein